MKFNGKNGDHTGPGKPDEKPEKPIIKGEELELEESDTDPDEIVLCVLGGKCYTRAELEAPKKSEMPLFEMED